jgi:hypothetical protein
MARDLEKRLTEWGLWFHENRKRIEPMNYDKRLQFYEKTIDGLLELVAIAAEDIRVLEGRHKSAHLWIPNGIEYSGDVRKFG